MKFKMPKFNLRQFASDVYRKTRGKAPDIMMWVGGGLIVAGTVMACHASTKLPEVMDDYHEEKKAAEDAGNDPVETKKEIRSVRVRTAGRILRLYAPAAAVETTGLINVFGANWMTKVINTELGATCAMLTQSIKNIRENVRNEYGEEGEEKIFHGGYEDKEVVKVDEDGTEHVETVRVYKNGGMPSIYARWFVYGEATGAEENDDYNRHFLDVQQKLFGNPGYLRAHRVVYLNDIYKEIGVRRSVAGNHAGWIYDPDKPEGDNRIDLRIQEVYREKEGCPGEWEVAFLIDPNVDGDVDRKAVELGLIDP